MRAEKAGREEATGEVWSHKCRVECSHVAGGDVMLVGEVRLLRSWNWLRAV